MSAVSQLDEISGSIYQEQKQEEEEWQTERHTMRRLPILSLSLCSTSVPMHPILYTNNC